MCVVVFLFLKLEFFASSHLCRYTVISGTPEKILEHFLETMRMDIHHSEPGNQIKKYINQNE